MLIALNKKKELVHANSIIEGLQTKSSYCCPNCKDAVFLKKGTLKVAHFSHFNQSNCRFFSEGETKEHLQGKQLLYEWFMKQGYICQLEAYLPDLNQRPDILVWITPIKALAIEFQCSSLSIKKMEERTVGYKKYGYDVLWIVGSQFKLKDRITASQRLFVYNNSEITFSLFFLDVKKKIVILYSDIQYQNITQKISYDSYIIKLNEFNSIDSTILKKKIMTKIKNKRRDILIKPKELLESHRFLNQGRIYRTPEIVSFQKYIYLKGDSLISLPKEIYFNIPGQIMIKTLPHFWKYILLEWFAEKELDTVVTLKELDCQINELISNKAINFYPMPLLSSKEQKKPLYAYVKLLIQLAILEEKEVNQWILKKKPYYYKNEQEKMMSFSNNFFN